MKINSEIIIQGITLTLINSSKKDEVVYYLSRTNKLSSIGEIHANPKLKLILSSLSTGDKFLGLQNGNLLPALTSKKLYLNNCELWDKYTIDLSIFNGHPPIGLISFIYEIHENDFTINSYSRRVKDLKRFNYGKED